MRVVLQMGGAVPLRGIAQMVAGKVGQKIWWAGASAHAAFAAGAASHLRERVRARGHRGSLPARTERRCKGSGIRIMVLIEAQSSDDLSQSTFEGWGGFKRSVGQGLRKSGGMGLRQIAPPRSAGRTGRAFGGGPRRRRSGAKKLGVVRSRIGTRRSSPCCWHAAGTLQPHRSRVLAEATS